MASFVGVWETKRHRGNNLANPDSIVLTISEDATPGSLDGSYWLPGQDARLFGAVDGTGTMMYGSWSSQNSQGPLQPWYATRVQTTRK